MLLLDEPTNHLDAESVEWLEQFLTRFPGTVVAVTHDRYFLDNAAEWILELDRGRGIPWKGNYSDWLQQKSERLKQEESQEKIAAEGAAEGTRVVAPERQGRPQQGQGAPAAPGRAAVGRLPASQRDQRDLHPAGRAPRRQGDRVQERLQELRRPPADRRPEPHHPAGRHRRHHRPQRRRQVDAVQDDHRPGKPDSGEVNIGHTVKIAYVDQSPRHARRRQERLAGSVRRLATSSPSARSRSSRAPTSAASTSRARTSRSWSARCPAVSAAACTWPRPCCRAATCCCSTNRPTTSTSRPCARWKTRCWSSPAASW